MIHVCKKGCEAKDIPFFFIRFGMYLKFEKKTFSRICHGMLHNHLSNLIYTFSLIIKNIQKCLFSHFESWKLIKKFMKLTFGAWRWNKDYPIGRLELKVPSWKQMKRHDHFIKNPWVILIYLRTKKFEKQKP